MGVTISHKIGLNKICVKQALDRVADLATWQQAEAKSKGISYQIRRLSDFSLLVDVGGCETLGFSFKSVKSIIEGKEKSGYSYEYSVLTDDGKK